MTVGEVCQQFYGTGVTGEAPFKYCNWGGVFCPAYSPDGNWPNIAPVCDGGGVKTHIRASRTIF